MSQQYAGPIDETPIRDHWKQLEGQTVNAEFPLRQYVGGSAHSAVFLTELGEGRSAAIKLVPESFTANAKHQLAAWDLASYLSHPNLIRIFHNGRWQFGGASLLYVVMELVDEDLSQVLGQRPLTPAETLEVLQPALDALAYVHSKGFVHGHIKPSNIMAMGDQLKLSTDRLYGEGDPVACEEPYDPPDAVASAVTDVWSLGMLLVEALTQRLPARKRDGQDDPTLSERLPAPFSEIVEHCLRGDPKHRWTVSDIAAHLQRTFATVRQEPEPVEGKRESSALWRYLVPAVIVAMVGVLAMGRLFNHRSEQRDVRGSIQEAPLRSLPEPKARENVKAPPKRQTSLDGKPAEHMAPIVKPAPSVTSAGARPNDLPQNGVIHEAIPDVPQKARNTIRGSVRVSVKVDVNPSGSVTDATIESQGPSMYFANLAAQAAKQWQFKPTENAASWILYFQFSPADTRVSSAQTSR
jgi:TonB family protein